MLCFILLGMRDEVDKIHERLALRFLDLFGSQIDEMRLPRNVRAEVFAEGFVVRYRFQEVGEGL